MAFIDRHQDAFGVEPICKLLQIAPSGYWRHAARVRDPSLRSSRAQRDEALMAHIKRVWKANFQVYGADKVYWNPSDTCRRPRLSNGIICN